MSLELGLEFSRRVFSVLMELLDHGTASSTSLVLHLNITEETFSDRLESILWPLREPINGGTIDKRWEVSHSVSEGISDWGEAQHDMQELFAPLNEV